MSRNHCHHCGTYIVPGICDPERPCVEHTSADCRDVLRAENDRLRAQVESLQESEAMAKHERAQVDAECLRIRAMGDALVDVECPFDRVLAVRAWQAERAKR